MAVEPQGGANLFGLEAVKPLAADVDSEERLIGSITPYERLGARRYFYRLEDAFLELRKFRGERDAAGIKCAYEKFLSTFAKLPVAIQEHVLQSVEVEYDAYGAAVTEWAIQRQPLLKERIEALEKKAEDDQKTIKQLANDDPDARHEYAEITNEIHAAFFNGLETSDSPLYDEAVFSAFEDLAVAIRFSVSSDFLYPRLPDASNNKDHTRKKVLSTPAQQLPLVLREVIMLEGVFAALRYLQEWIEEHKDVDGSIPGDMEEVDRILAQHDPEQILEELLSAMGVKAEEQRETMQYTPFDKKESLLIALDKLQAAGKIEDLDERSNALQKIMYDLLSEEKINDAVYARFSNLQNLLEMTGSQVAGSVTANESLHAMHAQEIYEITLRSIAMVTPPEFLGELQDVLFENPEMAIWILRDWVECYGESVLGDRQAVRSYLQFEKNLFNNDQLTNLPNITTHDLCRLELARLWLALGQEVPDNVKELCAAVMEELQKVSQSQDTQSKIVA